MDTGAREMQLVILFDEPFWIGLVLVEGVRETRVHRHVFGSEPTDPEVALFARDELPRLIATNPAAVLPPTASALPPTRAGRRRYVEAALARTALTAEIEAALAATRSAQRRERRAEARLTREAEEERLRALHHARARARHHGR
jgi:hypothetical protein